MAAAQTNLQLFNELARDGYSDAGIDTVRGAYTLAMQLFTGMYRPSGKTFIAHLIGTASALAACGSDATVVAAGLTHAAYTHGEFGTGCPGITRSKRGYVAAAIGDAAEARVAAYTTQRWDEAIVLGALERPPPRGSVEADVLAMRLANEVDEYEDLGALYAPDAARRVAQARTFLPLCAALARMLWVPHLAIRLEALRDQTLATAQHSAAFVPVYRSTLVPPLSHAPRLPLRLRRFAGRVANRARRAVRSRRV